MPQSVVRAPRDGSDAGMDEGDGVVEEAIDLGGGESAAILLHVGGRGLMCTSVRCEWAPTT